MHHSPAQGHNYYRLKQVDYDGVYEYSKTISVEVGEEGRGFWLSPNPSPEGSPQVHIRLPHQREGFYNELGRQVYQLSVGADEPVITADLPDLPSGVYVAVLQSGRERFVERWVVE